MHDTFWYSHFTIRLAVNIQERSHWSVHNVACTCSAGSLASLREHRPPRIDGCTDLRRMLFVAFVFLLSDNRSRRYPCVYLTEMTVLPRRLTLALSQMAIRNQSQQRSTLKQTFSSMAGAASPTAIALMDYSAMLARAPQTTRGLTIKAKPNAPRRTRFLARCCPNPARCR